MPIQNYPRFLTKASKTAQQIQSGLPIVGSDGVSGDFNALKVNSDGSINVSGGGGGNATASNQVTQITEAQTTNNHLTTIEDFVGLSVDGNFRLADLLRKVQQYSQFNTFFTKAFNCSGTHTFNMVVDGVHPFKIVFFENTTTITGLTDRTNADVLSKYFANTTANPIANVGTEIISRYITDDDLFTDITLGTGHFVAYYLFTPNVNP
jgi:hypothetical protein